MSNVEFKPVKVTAEMRQGPIKIGAYEVWDFDNEKYHAPQIHFTIDNTVYGVMGVESARLLAKFVELNFPQDDDTKGGDEK
jgi:hypothetical protein